MHLEAIKAHLAWAREAADRAQRIQDAPHATRRPSRMAAVAGNFAAAYEHMDQAYQAMEALAVAHSDNSVLALEELRQTIGFLERMVEKYRRAVLAASVLSVHVHDLEVGMLLDLDTDTHIQTAGHA
ncbi:hypothetical protein [Niveispirillum sp.]|uniref:hypothetical protein n=1 Tax=Niveispirillum sp. TaxID=1917217 RepID=UPI001B7AE254|nr:hypothetical protein [Niveispirillum sp.]MBP7334937.1 hypothetical protein [Niveispirillum sp.]